MRYLGGISACYAMFPSSRPKYRLQSIQQQRHARIQAARCCILKPKSQSPSTLNSPQQTQPSSSTQRGGEDFGKPSLELGPYHGTGRIPRVWSSLRAFGTHCTSPPGPIVPTPFQMRYARNFCEPQQPRRAGDCVYNYGVLLWGVWVAKPCSGKTQYKPTI